mmetsp:Transcript_9304/g.21350  ORF Transcript_9304/g.21350 Transcript_9304/m.21350 type:complete len:214 (+) Transcript_9304:923-1564(+)
MSSKTTRSRRRVSICSRSDLLAAIDSLNFCSPLSSRFSNTRICLATAFVLSREALTPPCVAISWRFENTSTSMVEIFSWRLLACSLSASSFSCRDCFCSVSFVRVSVAILFSAWEPGVVLVSFSSAFIFLFSRVSFSMVARCLRMVPCVSSLHALLSFSKTRNLRCNSAISCSIGLRSSSFFFVNIALLQYYNHRRKTRARRCTREACATGNK